MVRPTVLRIPKGLDIQSNPKLVKCLTDLIGPYGKPEEYVDENDVKEATYKRMLSLSDAFTFLLAARDCKETSLSDYARSCCDLLIKEVDSNESAKATLGKFCQILIDILSHRYTFLSDEVSGKYKNYPNYLSKLNRDEALKQLNRAEQYYLLTQVRSVVATLSTIQTCPEKYLIQIDRPVQAFTEKTIEELGRIRQYAQENGKSTPSLPPWFNSLYPELRAFLLNAIAEQNRDKDIQIKLNTLLRLWEKHNNDLEPKTIEYITDYAITRNEAFLPEWLKSLPEISKLLLSDCFYQRYSPTQLETEISKIKNNTLPNTNKLPAWYFFLEAYERDFLVQSLSTIKDLRDVSLPSRLRSLPGLANGGVHNSKIIDDGGVLMEIGERYRGAHLVSRDNFLWPLSLQGDAFHRNVSLIPHENSLQVTTLISPSKFSVALTPLAITQHPDSWLDYILERAFETEPRVSFVNLPVNYYGGAYLPWSPKLKETLLAYLKEIDESNNPEDHLLFDLRPLIVEACDLLDGQKGDAPWNVINLRLAATYHLIGIRSGASFGSCVSGKDRYAVFLSYVNAMMVYKDINGDWPAFSDSSNVEFNQLVMTILKTNHQSKLSSDNAPGATGLKNLHDYLRKIAEDRDKTWIKEQDQMASTNEMKVIRRAFNYDDGLGERLFRCIAIGDDLCAQINAAVHAICQEKELWEHESTYDYPEGVAQMRQVFSPGQSNRSKEAGQYLTYIFWRTTSKQITWSSDTKQRSPILVLAEVLKANHDSIVRNSRNRGSKTKELYGILSLLSEGTVTNQVDDTETAKTVLHDLKAFYNRVKLEGDEKRSMSHSH